MRIIGAGHRDDFEYRELRTFWTVPNLITVVRFLLVPVFVWLVAIHEYAWASVNLALLGSTDWVDGYIARRWNQISTVGKWLDPLADRLSLIIVALTLVFAGVAPSWLVYALLVPDALLIVNSLVLFRGSPDLPVTNLGKIRTALLLAGTPLLLFGRSEAAPVPWIATAALVLLGFGCALHILASVGYFVQAQRKARAERTGRTWSG